jgi:hypothetical protein
MSWTFSNPISAFESDTPHDPLGFAPPRSATAT